jgi:translation initiation factor IF-1
LEKQNDLNINKTQNKIIAEGTVREAYPGLKFDIELDNGFHVLAYLSGRMRRNNIRVILADRVKVEITPYDLSRGRIVYRYRRQYNRK